MFRPAPAMILMVVVAASSSMPARGADFAGVWTGALRDSIPIALDLELSTSGEGGVSGKLDVPQFALYELELADLEVADRDIRFSSKAGAFAGVLQPGRISGTWQGLGRELPFDLTRDPERRLYAVHMEDVHFESGDVSLSGTLYLPADAGPSPAVVLVHGSGPETRDNYASYARLFARHGVVALAYDKRGTGKSGGEKDFWRRFELDVLARDAVAAVTLLAARPEVDAGAIGVLGMSQGGWVAPLAASQADRVSWLVGLSASVTTVAEDRLFERAARLRKEGFDEDEIALVREMQLVDQELTRSGRGFEEFSALWKRHEKARWFKRVYLRKAPIPGDHEWRQWYRTQLDFDPVPLLSASSIPSLWLFGDPALDRFGPVEASMANLRALQESGKRVEFESHPGADHGLSVKGRWPDTIFAPEVLPRLVTWVRERGKH